MNVESMWTVQFDLDGAHKITPPLGATLEQLACFCEVKRAIDQFVTASSESSSAAA